MSVEKKEMTNTGGSTPDGAIADTKEKVHKSHKFAMNCDGLSFAAKEAFKRLRTNVIMAFPREDTSCKLIGVTSAQPNEGKSTVTVNLAYSIAELGKKVLLLDADMRRPSAYSYTGLQKTPGLSNLLNSSNDISKVVQKFLSRNKKIAFDVITGGDSVNDSSELMESDRMAKLIEILRSAYDYIIVDLPPVGAVIDAITVSKFVDGYVVVVHENYCPKRALDECMEQLSVSGSRILGFVMNGALEGSKKKYGYGRKYGYGGRYYGRYSGYYGGYSNYYGGYRYDSNYGSYGGYGYYGRSDNSDRKR